MKDGNSASSCLKRHRSRSHQGGCTRQVWSSSKPSNDGIVVYRLAESPRRRARELFLAKAGTRKGTKAREAGDISALGAVAKLAA